MRDVKLKRETVINITIKYKHVKNLISINIQKKIQWYFTFKCEVSEISLKIILDSCKSNYLSNN